MTRMAIETTNYTKNTNNGYGLWVMGYWLSRVMVMGYWLLVIETETTNYTN